MSGSVPDGAVCAAEEHCITCGDTSVPMVVLSVDTGSRVAECRLEEDHDAVETVDVWLVEDVRPGERLMVHAGTAVSRIEEAP